MRAVESSSCTSHIDVPGVRKEELEVTLENGVLTVHGERKYEHDEKDRVLLGRSYGAFSKSFTLPDDVDAEQLSADLHDGVLSIRVPRHEKARPPYRDLRGRRQKQSS